MLSLYINSGLTDFCFKITKKKWEGQSVSCLLQICILLPGIEYWLGMMEIVKSK